SLPLPAAGDVLERRAHRKNVLLVSFLSECRAVRSLQVDPTQVCQPRVRAPSPLASGRSRLQARSPEEPPMRPCSRLLLCALFVALAAPLALAQKRFCPTPPPSPFKHDGQIV